jgi:hypothetical protein
LADADLEVAYTATLDDGRRRHVSVAEARDLLEPALLARFAGNRDHARAFLVAVTGHASASELSKRDCVNLAYYVHSVATDRLQEIIERGHPGDTYLEFEVKLRCKGEATVEQRRLVLENARRLLRQDETAPPGLAVMGVVVVEGTEITPPRKTALLSAQRRWRIRRSGSP